MPLGNPGDYLSSVFGLSSLILTANDKPIIVCIIFASGPDRNVLHSIFLLNMLLRKAEPKCYIYSYSPLKVALFYFLLLSV